MSKMNPLKISRVRIRNFKSIIEFDQVLKRDLMIFDGPNGFGKTTLFDAFELVMFGRIKRIDEYKIVDLKQGYRDSLYFNNPDKDVIIQVQFYSEESAFVVTKRLPSRKKTKGKSQVVAANAPTAWDQFETYITDDFIEHFETLEPVKQEQVHVRLGVAHIMRAFHLFYYIQQEEKTYFIKSTEKTRLQVLSDLFDTKKEEDERKKLDDIKKAFTKRLEALEKDIEHLKKEIVVPATDGTSLEVVIQYSPLITQNIQPAWDQELFSVSADLRQKSHEELDQIKDLVLHIESFKAATFNKKMNNLIGNKILLQAAIIIYSHLLLDPTELRAKEQRLKEYKNWLHRLTRENLLNEINREGTIESLIQIAKTQKWYIEEEIVLNLLTQIRRQRKNSNELSDIVLQINETRDALLSKNNKFLTEVEGASKSECPMCGQDWITFEALSEQLEIKRKVFEQFYSDSAQSVIDLTNELYNKHITIIRDKIQLYVDTTDNLVDASFFEEWETYEKYKAQVQSFADWCGRQGYDLSLYVNNQMTGVGQDQLEAKVIKLQDFLRSKMLFVEADYQHTSDKFSTFDHIVRTFFANDISHLKKLSVELIEQKQAYIDQVFYRTNARKQTELQIKLQQLNSEQKRILDHQDNVITIIKTYDIAIREHWSKIISDIEVIFYLYFSKVTQYYQRGLGMFIQQQREADKDQGMAKALRFVCHANSDQDAINYLSSGQLSALVIAFTLALNRVYNRGLGLLLIDDPVQTMDEINMASLTELLRNDFRGMQIVVSTHEEQVARYLKYKFLKYSLEAERINMKDNSLQFA